MKQYTHLIWDFNGTLLDDVESCIKSANRLLVAHGLSPIASVEQYRSLFGFPIIDYYRRLGFDFSVTPYADLAVEWVAYYLEQTRNACLYPDVTAVLDRFSGLGLQQLILSATELGMLEGQVNALGIRDRFDQLLGLENIQAYSKEQIGIRWRVANPGARPLLIGDTDHDAAVAAAMGIDCVLICRGHQSRSHLECCAALGVFDSLEQMCRTIFHA